MSHYFCLVQANSALAWLGQVRSGYVNLLQDRSLYTRLGQFR